MKRLGKARLSPAQTTQRRPSKSGISSKKTMSPAKISTWRAIVVRRNYFFANGFFWGSIIWNQAVVVNQYLWRLPIQPSSVRTRIQLFK